MIVPIVLFVVFIFVAWKYYDEESPVDVLPGPRKVPILGNVFALLSTPPNDLFRKMQSYTKMYGERYHFKVFKIRVIHTGNPGDIEAILTHTKNITKSLPYTFLESWLGTGLLLSTGSKWHKRRKILTPTFHFNILKSFFAIMEEKSKDFVQRLKDFNGAPVDVVPLVSDFTLFTICETAMGTKLDSDKSSAAVEYKKAILEIGHVLLDRVVKFWLHNEFMFRNIFGGRSFDQCLNRVHRFTDNVIIDKKNKKTVDDEKQISGASNLNIKKRLAMLDLLLEAESKGEIDLEGIREEVNTFMFEGHDTTAMAITFGLLLIADHEDVQERIYEECQQLLGDDTTAPTLSDLAEMKYLEAVIKETLRMYPSVPFIGRQVTEDFYMGGIKVPKDTQISLHLYDLHHREDYFPEPDAFKPERFLSGENRPPYVYVPFSAGLRNCIGQRFAMQELKCVLSEVCRNFKLIPQKKGFRPKLMASMVLRPEEPVLIKFIPRHI